MLATLMRRVVIHKSTPQASILKRVLEELDITPT